MSSARRRKAPRPIPITYLADFDQEQLYKIAKDFRCGDCCTEEVDLMRLSGTRVIGLFVSHEPDCPVRTGLVDPASNYAAALAR
ncbi:hypothetical protein [Streptomyces sp. NPDC007172]|uniref:hypothetical protein n=1 Tax=Streptomyces sp. NPDC007172 TaxID=3364776 RepID=UPI003681393D